MNARQQVQILQNIVSRKGSSKVLTFSVPHVFKALQMLHSNDYVSRATFCEWLHMGEGAVKTMILHLKEEKVAESTRSGTYLTALGKDLMKRMQQVIAAECQFGRSSVTPGRFNHAVLMKNYSFATKTGMEQRDYAIMYGAAGATTLFYRDGRFIFPSDNSDGLRDEPGTRKNLEEELRPENEDMVIIASADDPFVAEIAAKNSALWTMATHVR